MNKTPKPDAGEKIIQLIWVNNSTLGLSSSGKIYQLQMSGEFNERKWSLIIDSLPKTFQETEVLK